MGSRVKFPIKRKILGLMVSVVLVAIITYLLLAVNLFKEDKTTLVYELNSSNVRTIAAELRSGLSKIIDKVKLLTQGYKNKQWIETVLEADEDIVSFALYQAFEGNTQWKRTTLVRNLEYLKLYDLTSEILSEVRQKIPVSVNQVMAKNIVIMNSTLPGSAPLLTLAFSLKLGEENKPGVAVIDVRLDRTLKMFQKKGIATVYLVNSDGFVLAHPNPELMMRPTNFNDIPIVSDSINSKVSLEMKRFLLKEEWYLGAYADVGVAGLKVISQVSEEHVFRAAQRLIAKSALVGLFILTLALFLSSRFAKTLTEPLNELLHMTGKVMRWDFGQTVQVKTNDEVGQLASAFNLMSKDLKAQRDQIDQHQAELEGKVKERTRDLEEQKKKAAEANAALVRTTRLAALGELAGVAAHEVLNPVNNMNIRIERIHNEMGSGDKEDTKLMGDILSAWKKTYDQSGWEGLQSELSKDASAGKNLLQEDLENLISISKDANENLDKRLEDLDFLKSEVVRVTKIINNMRGLARVKGDRRELDIQEPIDDTIAVLSDILEKKKINVETHYGPDTKGAFNIRADKDELVQVLSNVMRNSMQAITDVKRDKGLIQLHIRNRNQRIEIHLLDNGAGIPEENIPHIFEPDFTTKGIREGTGLGLSICRRLMRAFGGDIEVEKTKVGVGSVFLIWLPLTSDEDKKRNAS